MPRRNLRSEESAALMKAAAIDRFGPPSVITLHELPVPKPGPREILIEMRGPASAAGTNPSRRIVETAGWPHEVSTDSRNRRRRYRRRERQAR
jgi:hypothetical protein